MHTPLVTIIIPVYNVEKYLQRCIDSLRAQTYENTEMIFVDDGSTDSSYQILQKAAEMDPRIRLFSQKNAGPSAARNLGMDNCTGEYIMFCDSDDTVEPTWTEKMVEAIREYPDAWVVCEVETCSEDGNRQHVYRHQGPVEIEKKEGYYCLFTEGISAFPVNKVFSGEIIEKYGIRFDPKRKHGEDVFFGLDYLDHCSRILVVCEPLYHYYKYEVAERLTNRYHKWDFWTTRDLYVKRKAYISDRDLTAFQRKYWQMLSGELERTMKLCTDETIFGRIRMNQEFVRSQEYQELLSLVGRAEMNAAAFACLKMGRYDAYWLIQKMHQLKENLRKRIR